MQMYRVKWHIANAHPSRRAKKIVEQRSDQDAGEDPREVLRQSHSCHEVVEDDAEGCYTDEWHAKDLCQRDKADQSKADSRQRSQKACLGYHLLHPSSAKGQN